MAMPDDNPSPPKAAAATAAARDASPRVSSSSPWSALLTTPHPLKALFDRTPLLTYAANDLPLRAPRNRSTHTLHVFTTAEDARYGRPSFNPTCLRWQTYLRVHGVEFATVASSNHASPSGALPFLLPAFGDSAATDPIPSNRLKRWVASQRPGEKIDEPGDPRYEAYASLLVHRIRRAWLYQLYLSPANSALLQRLYTRPASSNGLVQLTLTHSLRRAATHELLASNPSSTAPDTISEVDILREAAEAVEALAGLLGEDEWFFGGARAGLFDAGVFGYTELILDEHLVWGDNALGEAVRGHGNVVAHRERMREVYY
ncbi:phosphatidylserine decarboxylase [Teratosphaeriaceae sp. CCFEE 6253]|nr:phosphatidylserine decarboxylase [Teratosphaeriaceae sp. CCFEE 6253]